MIVNVDCRTDNGSQGVVRLASAKKLDMLLNKALLEGFLGFPVVLCFHFPDENGRFITRSDYKVHTILTLSSFAEGDTADYVFSLDSDVKDSSIQLLKVGNTWELKYKAQPAPGPR